MYLLYLVVKLLLKLNRPKSLIPIISELKTGIQVRKAYIEIYLSVIDPAMARVHTFFLDFPSSYICKDMGQRA